jgi:hypothetical protein
MRLNIKSLFLIIIMNNGKSILDKLKSEHEKKKGLGYCENGNCNKRYGGEKKKYLGGEQKMNGCLGCKKK